MNVISMTLSDELKTCTDAEGIHELEEGWKYPVTLLPARCVRVELEDGSTLVCAADRFSDD